MQCIINKNCFVNNYLRDLSLIIGLSTYESEYNTVTVNDPSVFETVFFEELIKEDRDILMNAFFAELNQTEPYEGESVIIDAHGNSEDRKKIFSPHEAVTYLKQPLIILLENDRYDGRFVRCVISQFGNARVKTALRNNSIKMGLSGGCGNTRNTLDEVYRSFSYRPKFLRYFVVWDSDREYPGKEVTKYNTDIPTLVEMNIKYHILYKREMENYLPEDAIKDLLRPCLQSWFDAFCSLTAEQKDYYDIDHGFTYNGTSYDSKNRSSLQPEIKTLFNSVSDTNFNILKCGFKVGNFKDRFSHVFEVSPYANKSTLLARTVHQPNPHELQDIVDTINQLL